MEFHSWRDWRKGRADSQALPLLSTSIGDFTLVRSLDRYFLLYIVAEMVYIENVSSISRLLGPE